MWLCRSTWFSLGKRERRLVSFTTPRHSLDVYICTDAGDNNQKEQQLQKKKKKKEKMTRRRRLSRKKKRTTK
ncbi:hypothetical protein TRSC58_07715 [Trypanosoma rangeli SC58]|uniref:Uncharacterized protein n=1 Tax=Trypanosoma rangeli SC58 TaxID=429131 RepID=A0A061IUM3_TRYRA|nr:hypothetical protein TRSC58_07715 [Trypanosoma rangeli SC58]